MRNRVRVCIDGENYTLVSESDEQSIATVAQLVDETIGQVRQCPGLSVTQSYILAACDLAEQYLKAVETADRLRSQMKEYLEESAQLRQQLNQLQRQQSKKKARDD